MPRPNENHARSDETQLGFNLPKPLSGRLDGLVAAAKEATRDTTRKELLAALVHEPPAKERDWADLLRRYRRAGLDEAVIAGHSPAYYRDPPRRRGPRDLTGLYSLVTPGMSPDDYGEPMRIRDAPSQRIAIRVPAEIDARLDDIVRTLEEAGERTSRGEVVAALILGASPTPDDVDALIANYRRYRLAQAKSAG